MLADGETWTSWSSVHCICARVVHRTDLQRDRMVVQWEAGRYEGWIFDGRSGPCIMVINGELRPLPVTPSPGRNEARRTRRRTYPVVWRCSAPSPAQVSKSCCKRSRRLRWMGHCLGIGRRSGGEDAKRRGSWKRLARDELGSCDNSTDVLAL